jgi:hypothetical protein
VDDRKTNRQADRQVGRHNLLYPTDQLNQPIFPADARDRLPDKLIYQTPQIASIVIHRLVRSFRSFVQFALNRIRLDTGDTVSRIDLLIDRVQLTRRGMWGTTRMSDYPMVRSLRLF